MRNSAAIITPESRHGASVIHLAAISPPQSVRRWLVQMLASLSPSGGRGDIIWFRLLLHLPRLLFLNGDNLGSEIVFHLALRFENIEAPLSLSGRFSMGLLRSVPRIEP